MNSSASYLFSGFSLTTPLNKTMLSTHTKKASYSLRISNKLYALALAIIVLIVTGSSSFMINQNFKSIYL